MTLQEWLFNGGDESLPAVRFVDWFGGGCGFCAVYRALALAFVLAVGWIGGPPAAIGSAIFLAVAFVALRAYARILPIPKEVTHDEL